MARGRKSGENKRLKPTLNRFAQDTSMLGFRYLHTRYKTWFRLLWAMVLTFFVGLTVYQVCERIAYYFIRNPLTTRRSYESPQHMEFPTVGICNKMQLKASALASRQPDLVRLLSLIYDDDGNLTTNQTLLMSLRKFKDMDLLNLHRAAHQKVEDIFLRCEIGKRGSCMEDIRPVLTPQGVCFIVSPNVTVRRPGPEATLTLLLNLELYEIIPGAVIDSGAILSIHDSSEGLADQYSSGIHLEAGKAVTIPINEVRKLYRHQQYCGRRAVGPFTADQYTKAACEWVAVTKEIQKLCRCRPVYSPYNSIYFNGDLESDRARHPKPSRAFRLKPCTISQEIECVGNYASVEPADVLRSCPENCQDVSFSSVVFGGRLAKSDLSTLLPSEWEDEKEVKVAQFQKALDVIPNHRIPVVREVQPLADIAQEFAHMATKVFSLMRNVSTLPCLAPKGGRELELALTRFRSRETIWERITTYLRRSLLHELKSTAAALGIDLRNEFANDSDPTYVHNESMVVLSILQLSLLERRTESSYGLKIMDALTRKKVLKFVSPFITDMKTCMMEIRDSFTNASEIAAQCRKIFLDHYNILIDAQYVYTFGRPASSVVQDYTLNMNKVILALRKFMFINRVKVLDWHDHNIVLKEFETFYRDGGKDNVEVHELMKLKKLMISDIQNYIAPLKSYYEKGLRARENVLRRLGIELSRHPSLGIVEKTANCLEQLSSAIPVLKKSAFIRGEWLSRVQRQVEITQSYSATPQYDLVNLLHVKLYFAHFKQETIKEERSFNLFILLAEIGGTIGLYVGATLLTVAVTIVFFFEARTRKAIVKSEYL